MHELGILRQILKTVNRVAEDKIIPRVKHIVVEVGDASGVVPQYLMKLYPVAVETYSALKNAELKILVVSGRRLVIKEIGY